MGARRKTSAAHVLSDSTSWACAQTTSRTRFSALALCARLRGVWRTARDTVLTSFADDDVTQTTGSTRHGRLRLGHSAVIVPAAGEYAPGHGAHGRIDPPTMPLLRASAKTLRGEDTELVRPYFVAHEQRSEIQRQRSRRRALWLAVHGVDVGPRWIHGVEVTAR